MSTIGAFTVGVARHSRRESAEFDENAQLISCTEVYSFFLEAGKLPHIGTPPDSSSSAVTGLPAAGSAHPANAAIIVQSYSFTATSDNKTGHDAWECAVRYDLKFVSDTDESGESYRYTAKRLGTVECSVDLVADAETGEPVVNAAGDPFDSVPQRTIFSPAVEWRRKQTAPPAALCELSGTVNASEFTALGVTFPPRTGRLFVSADWSPGDEHWPWEVTYRIEGRNLYVEIDEIPVNIGWDEAFLECGYKYLETVGGKAVRFMDEDEETGQLRPSAMPQPLTIFGTDGRGYPPAIRRVATARESDWSGLNAPAS
jgi:hypothetical protein